MGHVRITGGVLRGRKIRVPKGARPSSSRVREALFSIWSERVGECHFLDLFAGSGAVGIEAVSRGAAFARLVEGSAVSFRVLLSNLRDLEDGRIEARLLDLPRELEKIRSRSSASFDLIFVDPPYSSGDLEGTLEGCGELLAQDGELALEHSRRRIVPEESGPLMAVDQRTYGESAVTFYRWRGAA